MCPRIADAARYARRERVAPVLFDTSCICRPETGNIALEERCEVYFQLCTVGIRELRYSLRLFFRLLFCPMIILRRSSRCLTIRFTGTISLQGLDLYNCNAVTIRSYSKLSEHDECHKQSKQIRIKRRSDRTSSYVSRQGRSRWSCNPQIASSRLPRMRFCWIPDERIRECFVPGLAMDSDSVRISNFNAG